MSAAGESEEKKEKRILLYFFGDAYASPFDINKIPDAQRMKGFLTP